MKTQKPNPTPVFLKVFFVLPVTIFLLIAFSSCSAAKKGSKVQTEVTPLPAPPTPPPPPPPPPSPQSLVPGQKEDDAYLVVDEMPLYPGGDGALLRFVADNTRYPKEAKDKGIQGRVIARFKVKEDGSVSDVSVIKGVDTFLDNEALRVVNTLPPFKPGKLNGVEVPVWYMVPITFTLKDDSQQKPSRFEVSGTDTIYSYTNEMPTYEGGSEALMKFKNENIKYPQEIKSLGIEGVVFVRFLVEKNGSVSDIKIMLGASPSLDAEAVRVTRLMPAWQPGKENGKPVKFTMMTNYDFLITPRTQPVIEEGTPYVVVEEMPMFPGGDSALLAYISHNTKYPDVAKANGIQGRVIVRFCVTDVGGIERVSILKGVDPELDAEATRVVKTLPAFKPGKQGGKPVNVWYMVPITFGLSYPSTEKSANQPSKAPPTPMGYDEIPVFAGGESSMYKIINSKLVYPTAAKEKGISGRVIVRFTINTDGSVGEVSLLKGISPELDAEAIRVVKLLPAWKPGKLAGIPVKVGYSVPIIFSLK